MSQDLHTPSRSTRGHSAPADTTVVEARRRQQADRPAPVPDAVPRPQMRDGGSTRGKGEMRHPCPPGRCEPDRVNSPPCFAIGPAYGSAPCGAREPVLIDRAGPVRSPTIERREALVLDTVTHRFGQRTALADVSLTVAEGEIVCLVGPSGCGKSTLLRIAAGLETVQTGTVRINGQTVATPDRSLPPDQRGIGIVFQDYALFPHLSVLDNVRFGLSRLPRAERRQRALEALSRVGMADHAALFPHALSGGQQQRVALARALAPAPAVLLLDEPFSGLDARLRSQVRDETLHVLKSAGTATLLVTHDPEEAMFLADRIALMRDGRLVQVGTPADLFTRPVNGFAAAFFGEVNRLPGLVEDGHVNTALGRFCAPREPEGTAVEVMIRPEGILLSAPGDTPFRLPRIARVEAARLLGRSSLIHLALADQDEHTIHLHARVPGLFLPPEDSHVAVALDPRQAFVFRVPDPS